MSAIAAREATETPWGPLVAVVGPTGSGKSALALRLAEAIGGEVVNTDSLQVYRHFDIGTAKPGAAERARAPHHLIDVAEPHEPYGAGRYVADAQAALRDIAARERVPILCGGTGLYYRALLFGLADVPAVPEPVQARLEARIAAEGTAPLHAELSRLDPQSAAAIHPNDPARIARALGVYEATGRSISAHRRERPWREAPLDVLTVGVQWPRGELYARIDARVREMLAAGWAEEVAGLLARGCDARLKPMRAIGYAELARHLLAGGAPGDAAGLADAIAQRTRRFAKRQLTWFRRHPEVHWHAPGEAGQAERAVRNYLLARGLRR